MSFQALGVSQNGRYLINSDGTPFFYLADTAWGLFHRLNREDALLYLDDRAAKGFTAIQAVALDEGDGIRTPNAHGRLPLLQNADGAWDVLMPDESGEYSYWDHVRFIVRAAEERGLYIAFLPTWGDKFNKRWGIGPEVFEPDNAFAYGKWLGEMFRDAPNIIWVMGGDRTLDTRRHFEIISQMALGIECGDERNHIMTFHPTGGQSSATCVHDEPWLTFNMIQSGHTRSRFNYEMIASSYARTPVKPILDGEPGYEHHPESFDPKNGYMDETDARQFAYMALLSGACGHTYGDHSIWGFRENPHEHEDYRPGHFCVNWRQALAAPGSCQMRFAKELMLSRSLLTARPAPELLARQLPGVLHIPVLIGDNFLFAYSAQGLRIAFPEAALPWPKIEAHWYNPRNGEWLPLSEFSTDSPLRFDPPTGGRGQDWVLVIDEMR